MKTLRMALLFAALASAPLPAQDPAPSVSPFAPPEPAAEMDLMRKWEGTFKTQATFVKGAMLSEGGEAKGTFTVKRGLRGHAYVGEYLASGSGGDFEARSVRMYDPVTKKWKAWWFDSWVPGSATVSTGDLQPDGSFVSESESESGDKKLKMRMTEKWVDDNKVEQSYEADHGAGWQPVMNIVYARKGKWKEPRPKSPEKAEKKKSDGKPREKKSKKKKAGPADGASPSPSAPSAKEQEEKAAGAGDGGDDE